MNDALNAATMRPATIPASASATPFCRISFSTSPRPAGIERQLNLAVSPELLAKLDAELRRREPGRSDFTDRERGTLIGETLDLICSAEGQALTEKRRLASQRRRLDESTAGLRALGR